MGKSFRMPSGYGSVYHLSGNRRKPWAVAKTFGWDENGRQIKKIIGYAETKKDGLQLLMEYNKDPYDIEHKKITCDYIFNLTIEKCKKMVQEGDMSKSNCSRLNSAYNIYCSNIKKNPIMDLKYKQMQDIIDNCECGRTTKGYIKTIFVKMFECAKLELEIKVDLELPKNLDTGKKIASNMHRDISREELSSLWNLYAETRKSSLEVVLIMIYTGLRPQELIDIKITNVHIDENYMIGGCKTEAGKNRLIPIHNKIRPFIEARLNQEYLIMINNRKANYKDINKLFKEIMDRLKLEHLPYDCRHTMATRLDEYKITHPNSLIDDLTIKLLMGHAITDITQSVYIHRDAKHLVEAVNLIY